MASAVRLEGTALHAGSRVAVTLSCEAGPIRWEQRGRDAPLDAFVVSRADRGVTIAATATGGRIVVDLVEHLLAALAGLGVRDGVRIVTDDQELPLLDGGARRFALALLAIDAPRGAAPSLQVARAATFTHGGSSYRFERADAMSVDVEVDFPAPVGRQRARWDGDPDDFLARIAPARTFGWESEAEALRAGGRAAAVDLESVVVFRADGSVLGGAPPGPDEPARHKLLDLLGDLALHGGPPRGSVTAVRPGHTATHAVIMQALAAGVLVAAEGS